MTGKIWQEGCGDFATEAPSAEPDPSAEPPPSEPREAVFLDLIGWEEERPPWEEANTAWIEEWTGREDELNATVRAPFPGPIDASLAPTEDCTPGEIPTSSPTPSPTPEPTPTPVPTPEPTPVPTPVPTPTPVPSPSESVVPPAAP